jgi:CBS-domain-containing membrane protein
VSSRATRRLKLSIPAAWRTEERLNLPGWAWFAILVFGLAAIDREGIALALIPPFAATLSILLLLPGVGLAQPYPVVVGSTLGAGIGSAISLAGHGPLLAGCAGATALVVLVVLRAYHPPGVALSLYPLLLHPSPFFALEIVLPFTIVAVASASICSRIFPSWPAYPLAVSADPVRAEATGPSREPTL